jgi:DNA repair protein RecO (recombination protein O)
MQKERLVTRGLVLRVTETKEADDILTVLTAEHGKLTVIARGARRKTSKVSAVAQDY